MAKHQFILSCWHCAGATLTYDLNGGEGTPPPSVTKAKGSMASIVFTVSDKTESMHRDGYVFKCWSNKRTPGNTYYAGSEFYTGVDATLYAQWEKEIIITYVNEDGEGDPPPPQVVLKDNKATVPVTISDKTESMKKDGYIFAGWRLDSNKYKKKIYLPGETMMVSEDVTFYARWKEVEPITISYNVNGSTGTAPDSVTGNLPLNITISDKTDSMEREGYLFNGWNSDPNGLLDAYSAGEAKTFYDDTVLYAQWKIGIMLRYDGNGSTSGSAPASRTEAEAFLAVIADAGDLKKEGYAFNGWNTQRNGLGLTYIVGKEYNIETRTTLYAKWTELLSVTYQANNGSNDKQTIPNIQSGTEYVIEANSFAAPNGQRFDHWELVEPTNKSYPTTAKAGDKITVVSNVTYKAIWKDLPKYTVTYESNNGTGEEKTVPNIQSGTEYVIEANSFAAPGGKQFDHWELVEPTDKGYPTTAEAGDKITVVSDVTYKAIWKDIPKYTVTYESNNGSNDKQTIPNIQSGNEHVIEANSFTAPNGQQFDHWELVEPTDKDYPTTAEAGDKITVISNVTYKAIWKDIPKYTLTYESNNGSNDKQTISNIQSGTEHIIEANSFTAPNGQQFDHWELVEPNDKDYPTTVKAGDKITVISDVTYKAIWKDIPKYTVTYESNNGSNDKQTVPNIQSGTEYVIEANSFTAPDGKQFDHWELVEPTDKGYPTTAEAGDKITVISNVTYKAIWKDIPKYTVTYESNNGSNDKQTVPNIQSGNEHVIEANSFTAPNGQQFDHWELVEPTDKDYPTTAKAGDKITVVSNVTYKAIWKDNSINPPASPAVITYTSGVNKNASGYNEALGITHTFDEPNGDHHIVKANDSREINYVRQGYKFLGWVKASHASGVNAKQSANAFPKSGENSYVLIKPGDVIDVDSSLVLTRFGIQAVLQNIPSLMMLTAVQVSLPQKSHIPLGCGWMYQINLIYQEIKRNLFVGTPTAMV